MFETLEASLAQIAAGIDRIAIALENKPEEAAKPKREKKTTEAVVNPTASVANPTKFEAVVTDVVTAKSAAAIIHEEDPLVATTAPKKYTDTDVADAVRNAVTKVGRDVVVAFVQKFGLTRVTDLKEADREKFITGVTAL